MFFALAVATPPIPWLGDDDPSPFKPVPKPPAKIDGKASPAVKPSTEASKIQVKLWTFPGCGPCGNLESKLKAMPEVSVTKIVETGPYSHAVYPVLTMTGKAPLVGDESVAAIRSWLGLK